MWIRKRIDIGWPDLLFGMAHSVLKGSRGSRERLVRRIENQWPRPEHVFVCLSVRSGFDLMFEAVGFPRDSEILMTALTIPDMPTIVAQHGCIPIPIDLDPGSMGPAEEGMHKAVTPSTRAIVVAHLFGAQIPMTPILNIAREHNLLVIEDCAQAFAGRSYAGHPEADVSMFSFGNIKTATALGGGVLMVRDETLRGKMIARQNTYPVQSTFAYFKRLLKYSALNTLTGRSAFSALYQLSRLVRRDYDLILHRSSRGFAGEDLLTNIRQQPCPPLLALLERRLRCYPSERIRARGAKGDWLLSRLRGEFHCPGADAVEHTYWVFPVAVRHKQKCLHALRRAGFDATDRQSMRAVLPPAGRHKPMRTETLLDRIIYLPLYPRMPEEEVERMAKVLRTADAEKV